MRLQEPVPPPRHALRERKPDVLLLAEKYAAEHDKPILRISTAAIDMLVAYHWLGNVRELESTIERAVLVCEGEVVHSHHLPPTLQTAEATGTVKTGALDEIVGAYERDIIEDALKTTRGNVTKAAKLLQTTGRPRRITARSGRCSRCAARSGEASPAPARTRRASRCRAGATRAGRCPESRRRSIGVRRSGDARP